MKLNSQNIYASSNIEEDQQFGMDKKDMPHITNILRSQLYSDKLLAILREYSTNAMDAHVEVGKPDTPITVTFPTLTEQTLSIRDYGDGLTEQEVMEIYIKYGASTKRNSNAFTGCLGIGCKSGFSYSTQFTITSYKDGYVKAYSAKINEKNLGTITKVVDTATQEANGVKITIPIKSRDHDDLKNKGKNLFQFWDVPPVTNINIEPATYSKRLKDYAIIEDARGISSSRYGDNHAIAYMGNIVYKIDESIVNSKDGAVDAVLSCGSVILFAPLGSLDIAASRESLEYTDKTKNQLINLAVRVKDNLSKEINTELETINSPVSAAIKAQEYLAQMDYALKQVVQQTLRWQSSKLLTSIKFDKPIVKHIRHHRYRANDYVNKRETDILSTSLISDMFFCQWDPIEMSEANATRRIRTLQSNRDWKTDDQYFLIKKGQTSTPTLIDSDIIDLTTIEPLPVNRTTITNDDGDLVKKVKVSVCKMKPSSMKSGRITENIEPEPEEDGKYYYVPLDRYDWMGMTPINTDPLSHLCDIQQSIKHLNYIISGKATEPTLYGVKKHHLKKLNSNWVDLKTYLVDLYEKAKEKQRHKFDDAIMTHSCSSYELPTGHATSTAFNQANDPDLRRLAKLDLHHRASWSEASYDRVEYTSGVREIYNSITQTMIWIGLDTITQTRVDMEKEVVLKYPLLPYISSSHGHNSKVVTALNQYINLIKGQ